MRLSLILLTCLVCCVAAFAEDQVIERFDELRLRQPKEKASASLVKGHEGQAIEFKFDDDSRNAFFTMNLRPTPEWDDCAGFSFWVKGDGSKNFGALQFIYNDDYAIRYDYCFPLRDTQWRKVTVAWRDLVPVLPGPNSHLLNAGKGSKPSKLSALWVGKWWYWRDYPAHRFALDHLQLEPKIDISTPKVPKEKPLTRLLRKLDAGEPITIVTMGDSLTDVKHWANRKTVWTDLLAAQLQEKYKSKVTIVNPAIGGNQLRQGLIQIPRWQTASAEPDLVTVFYGGNDWDAGMRGDQFRDTCEDAIDRIRRATGSKAEVMLLTTAPTLAQWDTRNELGEAAREAATKKNAALADVQRAFQAIGEDARPNLFVSDKVHLGDEGHRLVAQEVLKAIEAAHSDR